jgi:hypothetical protein
MGASSYGVMVPDKGQFPDGKGLFLSFWDPLNAVHTAL